LEARSVIYDFDEIMSKPIHLKIMAEAILWVTLISITCPIFLHNILLNLKIKNLLDIGI
jgi:hypothetical protein